MVASIARLSALRSAQSPGFTATSLSHQGRESACSFAGFRLEADGTLWRDDTVVHLPPKELAALRLLLANASQVVSPLELKQALWGNTHVTADSVPKCMSSLRARLEPDVCIQTVYKRGYRFSAEIRWNCAPPAGMLLRLAILPFATGHFVPQHLGPAIAEETTASLSRSARFAVAVLARDSVFNLARRGLTAQQIGKELKADLVLAGTLHAFTSHYRLRAEMIRVEDGTQIWVEELLAPQNRTDVLESELMHRLAYRLDPGVSGDRSSSLGWDPGVPGDRSSSLGWDPGVSGDRSSSLGWDPGVPGDRSSSLGWNDIGLEIAASAASETEGEFSSRQSEAYETLLQGRHEWQTLHRHRMQDGLQRLLRAIELDPSLISAKVDLAHLCVAQAQYGFMSPGASAELVHRMAESIPDLPHHAEAFLPALGWINFFFDRNLPAALRAFSFSAHLPHDPWTTRARSIFALSRRRFAEAIEILREAIRIDPFSPWLQNRLGWTLHLDGQRAESLEQIRKNLAQFPDSDGTCFYGSAILAFNGESEEGIEIAQKLAQRSPHFDLAGSVYAYALACAGRTDEARSALERLQWLSRERYVVRGFTPAAFVALGDHEAALVELHAADEARCPWFFQTLADPRLEPLHGNPEFERMRAILPGMEEEVGQDLETGD